MRVKALRARADTAGAPLLLSYPEAQRQLGGVHRGTVLKMIQRGELERVRIGRRAMITWRSMLALMQRATEEAGETS
jgi:excisionase family DNA binding protein